MEPRSDPEAEGPSSRPPSVFTPKDEPPKKYKRFPLSSILTSEPLVSDDFGDCQLTGDEASHLLRDYEKQAFSAVITALRCQGPLTPYKECLIEHLKYALFIRDHDYIEMLQESVSNSFLTKIANALNPSYSCEAHWQAFCFPTHSTLNPVIRNSKESGFNGKQRTKLFTNIGCHNTSVVDLDLATAKLCRLKKSLYIPQALRRQLYDSELSYGRVDLDSELTEEELRHEYEIYEKERSKTMRDLVIEEDALLASGRTKSRRKKKNVEAPFLKHTLYAQSRSLKDFTNGYPVPPALLDEEPLPTEEDQERAEAEMYKVLEDCKKNTSDMDYDSPKYNVSPTKMRRPRKSRENKHVMDAEASTSNESGFNNRRVSDEQRSIEEDLVLVKTAQAMIEDMVNSGAVLHKNNGVSNGTQMISPVPKKRGRRLKDKDSEEEGCSCARVRPFDFGPIRGNDPNKLPRGNPDKRTLKRKERKPTVPVISNGVSYMDSMDGNVMSTPQAALVPGNPPTIVIRPRTTSTAGVNQQIGDTSPAKRMRYGSENNGGNPATASGAGVPPTVVPAMFSVAVRPGRPTTFRPPNVVFPRATSALSNGAPRYAPFPQSSGNPTRPYYGNPGYINRTPIISRERPQMHTFTRPTTSSPVIRFVDPETRVSESFEKGQKIGTDISKMPIVFSTTERLGPEEPLPRRPTSVTLANPDLTQSSIYHVVATTSLPYMVPVLPVQIATAANEETQVPHVSLSHEILPEESNITESSSSVMDFAVDESHFLVANTGDGPKGDERMEADSYDKSTELGCLPDSDPPQSEMAEGVIQIEQNNPVLHLEESSRHSPGFESVEQLVDDPPEQEQKPEQTHSFDQNSEKPSQTSEPETKDVSIEPKPEDTPTNEENASNQDQQDNQFDFLSLTQENENKLV